MTVYQINPATKHEVILMPYSYLESTGEEQRHNTDTAAATTPLALDERGRPKTELALIKKEDGRLLYTAAADYTAMTDEQKRKAFYVPASNQSFVDRFLTRGSLAVRA